MPPSSLIPEEYAALLEAIRERIRSAQYEALRAVNQRLVGLYWEVGRMIVERQQDESWGRSVVERLAQDLQAEFPGVGGYSASNLWRMRLLYLAYQDNRKLAPLVREISWSHNLVILELGDEYSERQLETAILARVDPFLREMGGLVAFVGCQVRNIRPPWSS